MTHPLRPVALTSDHDTREFDSGQPALDEWLRSRAHKNEKAGASRTFVMTMPGARKVVGFYSLAASAVRLADAPGSIRRNMPDPIPVILLGRLAVARTYQGTGLGRVLLQDCVWRVLRASDAVGIRALLVHAIDETARGFYRRFGFVESPVDDKTLFLSLPVIRASRPVPGEPFSDDGDIGV